IAVTGITVNDQKAIGRKTIDVIDPSKPLIQPPKLLLTIVSDDGKEVATVGKLKGDTTGQTVLVQNKMYTFDLGKSSSEQDTIDQIKIEADFGSGFQVITSKFTKSFPQVGTFPVKIRMTDRAGGVTSQDFMIIVSCPADTTPKVQIDTNKIGLTSTGEFDFYKYDSSSAVTGGGGGPYKVRWDFDGDGIFDVQWMDQKAVTVYAFHTGAANPAWAPEIMAKEPLGGIKKVKFSAWDQKCNFFATADLAPSLQNRSDITTTMTNAVSGEAQAPQLPGYLFIQGKVNGLSDKSAKLMSTNTLFLATQKLTSPRDAEHVVCDYRDGNAKIEGMNIYDKFGKKGVNHGLSIAMNNLPKELGTFQATGKLSEAVYSTDTDDDTISADTYKKNADCTFSLTIVNQQPTQGTCSDGTPRKQYFTTLDGVFSCPSLVNTEKQKISIDVGAYYCEVSFEDGCAGGGGGGGGQAPIPR
ncbi:MAG: hypothetical protein HQK54_09480, partial [Oligoflexales bacterium]|nr:hypothetical protein [Oligoflexales bacterium]